MDNSLGHTLASIYFGENCSYPIYSHLMRTLHRSVQERISENILMLLQHEDVVTTTRLHGQKNFRSNVEELKKDGIKIFEADRGGDVTFHGQGQLVGYPIISISNSNNSNGSDLYNIEWFIRTLEQALLKTCLDLGVRDAMTLKGYSGIWFKEKTAKKIRLRKLIAIGVGVSNGVSKHGFAFNLNIDYEKFQKHIVPCGLKNFGVISLQEIFEIYGLELPNYCDILSAVSKNIAQSFSLTLKGPQNFNEKENFLDIEGILKHVGKYNHAATWGVNR